MRMLDNFGRHRGAAILAVATVLAACAAVVGAASPAVAGGTPYSPYNWAGVRAWQWQNNLQMWESPSRVTAQWQIPCLSSTDTRYGAYDQWIGIEGTQGTLIQVGVRSYHIDTGWGVATGYFAWVVDTRDAAARTPQQVFTIVRCGLGTPPPTVVYPRVYAEVTADGHVSIRATDTGNTWESTSYSHKWTGIAGPESPQNAFFILERFTSSASNTMPWFGSARFEWCWVGSMTAGGYYLGGDKHQEWVRSERRDMTSLLKPPPWSARYPAVLTSDIVLGGDRALHGDFNFTQWLTY